MIAIIADVHVGNHRRFGGSVKSGINRRCRHTLDALEAAVALALERGAEALLVAGDLYDVTNPSQQIVSAVQDILRHIPTWLLVGNHDQVSDDAGDHALGPLGPVTQVIETPQVQTFSGCEVFFVPFQPGPAMEWLPAVLEEWCGGEKPKYRPSEGAAMLLHLGISTHNTPSYMRGHHDAVSDRLVTDLCKSYGFDACFAGNWHFHKVHSTKPRIVQVGTLAPTGFDNPGFDHGQVVFWDGAKMEVEQVPGPRFLKVRADEEIDVPDGCQVYTEVTASAGQISKAWEVVHGAMDDGLICAGKVIQDSTEVREATRKAAIAARSTETLDEALSSFIDNMHLEEGVDRAAVLARTRGYLGM